MTTIASFLLPIETKGQQLQVGIINIYVMAILIHDMNVFNLMTMHISDAEMSQLFLTVYIIFIYLLFAIVGGNYATRRPVLCDQREDASKTRKVSVAGQGWGRTDGIPVTGNALTTVAR